jgi:hypothetical protein
VRRRVRHAVVRLWAGGVVRRTPTHPPMRPLRRKCVPCVRHAAVRPSPVPLSRHEQGPLCVCAPHSPAHTVGVQLVRQGGRRSWVREGSRMRCAGGGPCHLRIAVCVRVRSPG